ncbi:STAS domain-containing protein [Streptomyces sp. NPDC015171]|uniref:STAS domain-containing protein n=1 Tax=Streptomyces sp. NPDC015171 TaxID=3364945 RepID=UPI003702F7CB
MHTNVMGNERLVVHYHVVNGWAVLEIDGEADVYTSPVIGKAVTKLLSQGHRHFVLDLLHVPFMDSTGLAEIVKITKRIREHQGSLHIACPTRRILRVFKICGLYKIYELYDSPQEATDIAPVSDGLAHWPHPHD